MKIPSKLNEIYLVKTNDAEICKLQDLKVLPGALPPHLKVRLYKKSMSHDSNESWQHMAGSIQTKNRGNDSKNV